MLTLTLLRHAKSNWDDPELDDHERPLSRRGARAAPRVGAFIAAKTPPINRVLCSDAIRTRATLTLVLSELPDPAPAVSYEPDLYLASPTTYLRHLSGCADTDRHIMIVGHNPGIQMLALELVRDGDRKAITALARKFPTAALAMIEFEADHWPDATRATGTLRRFVTPKDLA